MNFIKLQTAKQKQLRIQFNNLKKYLLDTDYYRQVDQMKSNALSKATIETEFAVEQERVCTKIRQTQVFERKFYNKRLGLL